MILLDVDYFDMPAGLVFGRIIDSIDNGFSESKFNSINKTYNVWPDILEGLHDMFTSSKFQSNEGGYFIEMKKNPEKYIHRSNDMVIKMLRDLKITKSTFLITGSFIDFASFTASYALGENWQELFDFIICFAKKPGFFTSNRPFLLVENNQEVKLVSADELDMKNTYSQGNWNDLLHLLNQKTDCTDAKKILYVGDNLIQDIYAPSEYTHCDTIAVAEEMLAEHTTPDEHKHQHEHAIKSKTWGSFFVENNEPTMCSEIIKKYAKICIPTIDVIAQRPLDYEYECFSKNNTKNCGFYPRELGIV